MINDKGIKDVHLTMFNQEKKVFSGSIDDLPDSVGKEKKADRVELSNRKGCAVATMSYHNFKNLMADVR